MSFVIATADLVGSTQIKMRYGQEIAVRRIRAALELVRDDLCRADEHLFQAVPYAGDSILLLGGLEANAPEVYHRAVIHQAIFRAWHMGRLPLKLALGYGAYQAIEVDGRADYHGSDLDMLYAICAHCPPGGLVVTPAMYALLDQAGFGLRFYERVEPLKGFGEALFYESNGEYRAQKQQKKAAAPAPKHEPEQSRFTIVPQNRQEFVVLLTIAGVLGALGLAYLLTRLPT